MIRLLIIVADSTRRESLRNALLANPELIVQYAAKTASDYTETVISNNAGFFFLMAAPLPL